MVQNEKNPLSLRRIGANICVLPASEEPLSADVFCIQGRERAYFYDVGRTDEALAYVSSAANGYAVILSHFHGDHTENISRLSPAAVYGGSKTVQKIGFGTVLQAPLVIEDGVLLEIIPCPSVHASGSLILNVNREYCLVGDLFYFKPPLNTSLANEMLLALARVDTKFFVLSHGGNQSIYEKKRYLQEQKERIEKEKKHECKH